MGKNQRGTLGFFNDIGNRECLAGTCHPQESHTRFAITQTFNQTVNGPRLIT